MNSLLSAETMRLFLLFNILSMLLLAAFYLRSKNLPLPSYLGWGLLAVLLPLVGPFLVILSRPQGRMYKSRL